MIDSNTIRRRRNKGPSKNKKNPPGNLTAMTENNQEVLEALFD